MNKNQKTYLLLFAVAIVWGAIGYQFYKNYNPDIPVVVERSTTRYVPLKKNTQDSYTISPDYRDPFLGKIYRKKIVKIKKGVPKPKVIFPKIVFKGIVNGNKRSYIIEINGIQEVFVLKQRFQGITLVKATSTSIKMKCLGEVKEYTIEE
ncbi:MAG: hypothetical protein JKY02_00370 [Flavobacteriaceae bacterium]|nr:hypothetical protein [Flavobacteriaceae bacterium]